jgi:hypothetical protein
MSIIQRQISLTLFPSHRQPLWEVLTLQCVNSMRIIQLRHLLLEPPLFVSSTTTHALRNHLDMLHRQNYQQVLITLTTLLRLGSCLHIAHRLSLCHQEARTIFRRQRQYSPGRLHQNLQVSTELPPNLRRVSPITSFLATITIQRRRAARNRNTTRGITAEKYRKLCYMMICFQTCDLFTKLAPPCMDESQRLSLLIIKHCARFASLYVPF